MIKVLEHGIRKITCPNCKAKLQYEQEDIQTTVVQEDLLDSGKEVKYIICPDCDNHIILK